MAHQEVFLLREARDLQELPESMRSDVLAGIMDGSLTSRIEVFDRLTGHDPISTFAIEDGWHTKVRAATERANAA